MTTSPHYEEINDNVYVYLFDIVKRTHLHNHLLSTDKVNDNHQESDDSKKSYQSSNQVMKYPSITSVVTNINSNSSTIEDVSSEIIYDAKQILNAIHAMKSAKQTFCNLIEERFKPDNIISHDYNVMHFYLEDKMKPNSICHLHFEVQSKEKQDFTLLTHVNYYFVKLNPSVLTIIGNNNINNDNRNTNAVIVRRSQRERIASQGYLNLDDKQQILLIPFDEDSLFSFALDASCFA